MRLMRKNRAIGFVAVVLSIALISQLMAAQINIAGHAITANVEADSASTTVPGNITSCAIILTDPNGVWDTTVGNIKQWGVQRSTDGGATWQWYLYQGNVSDSALWLPFGSRNPKNGAMPSISVSSSAIVASAGDRVRLAIVTDTNIVLGATITTTP